MTDTLLSSETTNVLQLQGVGTEARVGALDAGSVVPILRAIAGEEFVTVFNTVEDAVHAVRTANHYAVVVGNGSAVALLQALGPEAGSVAGIIVVNEARDGAPTATTLRSLGAMAVAPNPTEEAIRPLLKRGLEFRALRALELAHRCESRRLMRREMELMGHPPETMTDDLNTFQAPPLPVGPISTYNLEEVSEAFERAYIDRVQHLCASAREAATRLDVSAATLARRLRKEVPSDA